MIIPYIFRNPHDTGNAITAVQLTKYGHAARQVNCSTLKLLLGDANINSYGWRDSIKSPAQAQLLSATLGLTSQVGTVREVVCA
jgi:hypothetical protein